MIALGMLIVTAILAIYTYELYNTAAKDSKTADTSASAANQSAKIAQQTLTEIKEYNTESLNKQQASLDKSDVANKKNFDRIDKSLDIQDSSLRETRREFEVNNAPYLQIKVVDVSKTEKGKPINISIETENLGAYPAKIESSSIYEATKTISVPIDEAERDFKKDARAILPDGSYVAKGTPMTHEYLGLVSPLSDTQYEMLMAEKWSIFIEGTVNYKNLANGQRKVYKYIIKINARGKGYQYILNDNYDVKYP